MERAGSRRGASLPWRADRRYRLGRRTGPFRQRLCHGLSHCGGAVARAQGERGALRASRRGARRPSDVFARRVDHRLSCPGRRHGCGAPHESRGPHLRRARWLQGKKAGYRRRADRRWRACDPRRYPGLHLRVGSRAGEGPAAVVPETGSAPLGGHRCACPEWRRESRRGRGRERQDQRLVDLRKGAADRCPGSGSWRFSPPSSSIRIGGGS